MTVLIDKMFLKETNLIFFYILNDIVE